jgi:cytidylate kinase
VIVSISRELGAGGMSVGEAVAAALGATLLGERTMIDRLAARVGLPRDFVAERVERPPSAGARLIADLASASAMVPVMQTWLQPEEELVAAVREIVIEDAQHGHVVVIGHGGVSLLGWRPDGIRVLAILLRASPAWRVAQLSRRLGIDGAEAERRVARTDEARQRFQRHYFNTDLYDSRQYDLVLCTETLGLERSIALAVEATTSATRV